MSKSVTWMLKIGLFSSVLVVLFAGTAAHAYVPPKSQQHVSVYSSHAVSPDAPCDYTGCDGHSVGSCANDEQKWVDQIYYSRTDPGRKLYEEWLFHSPSCRATWSAIANRSGDTLTYASAGIERITGNPSPWYQTGPTSLANGAHISSPMVGDNGDTTAFQVCADDIGVSGNNAYCN
ncbi:MAG: hypothetical protein ABI406_02195 [Ktedonobacteraceae bacterium]